MKNSTKLSVLMILIPLVSGAQTMNDNTLQINKSGDFDIDGKGTAREWGKTDWVSLNPLNVEAAYDTRVKILYSESGMYFLFQNEDEKITATIKEDNADLWHEDVVEVFLWTDEQYPMYFEYELSPLNYELPILIPKVGEDFLGWLPWHYEGDRKTRHMTHIQKDGDTVTGWIAEFFIPYDLLKPLNKVPPQVGTRWRANMYRIDHDKEPRVLFAWQPIVNSFHDHELFGTFEFK